VALDFYIQRADRHCGVAVRRNTFPTCALPSASDSTGWLLLSGIRCRVWCSAGDGEPRRYAGSGSPAILAAFIVGPSMCGTRGALANPILDLSLMRFPTFRLSVIGWSLTRIHGGVVPFLLPLMMQLGFGFPPRTAGIVTFVSALGAIAMKATAAPCCACGASVPPWSGTACCRWCAWVCARHSAGLAVVDDLYDPAAERFFQSLQFSAYNTVAYADIPSEAVLQCHQFLYDFQQLMLSVGICVPPPRCTCRDVERARAMRSCRFSAWRLSCDVCFADCSAGVFVVAEECRG